VTSTAEQLEVLKLVQLGQVTPEDGVRLLAALDQSSAGARGDRPGPTGPATDRRWLKLVAEQPGGQNVNLTLPLNAVPLLLNVAARWVPAEHKDLLRGVADAVAANARGELLNVREPGGHHVRIWVE
jgi:hypothetical protein